MVIHSERDSVVPVSHSDVIFNGLINTKHKEKKILNGLEHIGGYFDDEKGYIKILVDFMDNSFDSID